MEILPKQCERKSIKYLEGVIEMQLPLTQKMN